MKSIAVVGCGGIGMRHVEALGALRQPAQVYAVDPRAEAAERAATLFAASRAAAAGAAHVELLNSTDQLPPTIDLCIVATTAQVRLASIERLLRGREVRALVLEKFLFARDADYERAQQLLAPIIDSVWVNCSRRMYPGYRQIAANVAGARYIKVNVSGRASIAPIGTIGVHFADLLVLLSGDPALPLVASLAQPALIPTRRGGDDFSGTLCAQSNDGRFSLEYAARTDTDANQTVIIETDRGLFVIQEWCQRAWFTNSDGRLIETPFEVPFQSRITTLLAENILLEGRCELTPYAESAAIHRSLLAPMLHAFRSLRGDPSAVEVPFT